MNSLGLEIAKIVGAIVGVIAAALVAYWKLKDKRIAKDLGLQDNPERCGRHEADIKTLKERFDRFDTKNDEDHGEMFRQLGAMSVEIAKLGRNGGGGR
jgi:hypothetical protein